MAIEFVTAYKGEPHITSDDAGGLHQGIFGVDDYVLSAGKKLAATLVTNNSIKIEDGEAVMQGRHFRVKPGTYETVTIDNGTQNMKRKDLIIARYTKDSEGVEAIELDVLKGTPTTGTPVSKVPVKGDIRTGALIHEMILYTVELNGLNVVHVTPSFMLLMNMKELLDEINLQKNYSEGEVVIGKTEDGKDIYRTVFSNDLTYFTASENYQELNFSIGSAVERIIRANALIVRKTDKKSYMLPYVTTGGVHGTWIENIDSAGIIHFRNNTAWGSDYTMRIEVEYVKR